MLPTDHVDIGALLARVADVDEPRALCGLAQGLPIVQSYKIISSDCLS